MNSWTPSQTQEDRDIERAIFQAQLDLISWKKPEPIFIRVATHDAVREVSSHSQPETEGACAVKHLRSRKGRKGIRF